MLKKMSIVAALSLSLALAACGGRDGQPVMVMQYGDEEKSCDVLKVEMVDLQNDIQKLFPQTSKTGKNVALGVTGIFFIVPLFFMDFKNGEKEEYEADRQRYDHLAQIAANKHCGLKKNHYPTAKELEKSSLKNKEKENENH